MTPTLCVLDVAEAGRWALCAGKQEGVASADCPNPQCVSCPVGARGRVCRSGLSLYADQGRPQPTLVPVVAGCARASPPTAEPLPAVA